MRVSAAILLLLTGVLCGAVLVWFTGRMSDGEDEVAPVRSAEVATKEDGPTALPNEARILDRLEALDREVRRISNELELRRTERGRVPAGPESQPVIPPSKDKFVEQYRGAVQEIIEEDHARRERAEWVSLARRYAASAVEKSDLPEEAVDVVMGTLIDLEREVEETRERLVGNGESPAPGSAEFQALFDALDQVRDQGWNRIAARYGEEFVKFLRPIVHSIEYRW